MKLEKKLVLIKIVFAAIMLIAFFAVFVSIKGNNLSVSLDAGYEVNNYSTVEYKGKTLKYNTSLFSVLLIGVDSKGSMQNYESEMNAGLVDSLNLLIFDRERHIIRLLQINRDTEATVHKITNTGLENGTYLTRISYAFAYGDGSRKSLENTRLAVSELLEGIPVKYAGALNLDFINSLPEIFGELQVTVPNDDLADLSQKFRAGKTIEIGRKEVEPYLRYRDTEKAGSNKGRMERQKTYMNAAIKRIGSFQENDIDELWRKYEESSEYITTDIGENSFITLLDYVVKYEYVDDSLELAGKYRYEEDADAFVLNEVGKKELIYDLFYESEQ